LAALNVARQKGTQAAALEFATANYHAFGADAAAIYTFDNGVTIDSANNNTLLCSNVAQDPKTPGISGSSAYFNNTASFCYVSISSSIPSLASKGSVSFWIYPTAIGLISYLPGTGIYLCTLNSSNVIELNGGTCLSPGIVGTQNIPLNTWTQVFISWNSLATKKTVIYINGKLDSQSSLVPSINWTSGGPNIFVLGWWGGGSFTGYLDNFSVYTESIQ
jgi:hypothetical protein